MTVDGFAIDDGAAEMLVKRAVFQVKQGVEMCADSVMKEAVNEFYLPILA